MNTSINVYILFYNELLSLAREEFGILEIIEMEYLDKSKMDGIYYDINFEYSNFMNRQNLDELANIFYELEKQECYNYDYNNGFEKLLLGLALREKIEPGKYVIMFES